jgi:hypothetical protein
VVTKNNDKLNYLSQLHGSHQDQKAYIISVTLIAPILKAYSKDIPFGCMKHLNKSARDENPILTIQFCQYAGGVKEQDIHHNLFKVMDEFWFQ